VLCWPQARSGERYTLPERIPEVCGEPDKSFWFSDLSFKSITRTFSGNPIFSPEKLHLVRQIALF
jgi:hypothetical protein